MARPLLLDFLLQPGALQQYTEGMQAFDKCIWTLVSLPGPRAIDTRLENSSGMVELHNPTQESFMLVHDTLLYQATWGILAKGTVAIYPEACPYKRKVVDVVGVNCYNEYPREFVRQHIRPVKVGAYSEIGKLFAGVL